MKTNYCKIIGQINIVRFRAVAVAAFLTFAAPDVPGQTPGALDLSFDTGSTVNGDVRAIVPAGDGKVYVGGSFTSVPGAVRHRIARLNADGTVDETFNPGSGADGTIYSVVVQPDGKLLIGGGFTSYDGTARNYIARLNSNGSLDTSFDSGTGAGGGVYAIAMQADGKALIGGSFGNYNGTARVRIARIHSDGSLDTTFNPGTGADDTVESIVVQANGKVFIGGSFTTYDGTSRRGIARLNSNGSLDTAFNPGTGVGNGIPLVYSVAPQADGKVLIGGWFGNYNGTARNGIARLNSNGSLDTSFTPGTGGLVNSVALQGDGKVLMGGFSPSGGGTALNSIWRLNSDGSIDSTFNPGTGPYGVLAIAVQADGKLLIGGTFTFYNGTVRVRIARIHSDGSLDTAFGTGAGASDLVRSVAVQGDGKMLIGGYFTAYNNTRRVRIARINSDGSIDPTFNPSNGANGTIYSVVVQSDGKVLIGGGFSSFNGTARNCIARLNGDGSLDTTFNPGTGANGTIYSVVVQPDGKVLIGGGFSSFNGTARNRVARLNGDGSLDTTFNPGTGANRTIYSVVVQPDGKVLIGGEFSSFNGTVRNCIARLNGDASLDTTFNPGTGANSTVYSIAVQADGNMVIGGFFSSYNGTPRNGIARLHGNGSLDSSFDPGTGAFYVSSITLQSDGKVLIGGSFTSYNGSPRNGIARLNSDGSLDPGFDPGTGADGSVSFVGQQADGKVLIGGGFGGYNGTVHSFLARLANNPAIQSISVPAASQVQWLRGGAAPEIEQVSFEHSADGAPWTPLGAGTRIGGGWELTGLSLSGTGYIRARGRATTSGLNNGGSSVIEQVVSYITPAGKFDAWATAAGLAGPDAPPDAAPQGDGVPNIVKYAFNMTGSSPNCSVLAPGTGTGGLPVFVLTTDGSSGYFRCEFIRRIGSGLIYTAKKSTDLSSLSWVPLTDLPTVLPINADWERVIYDEPVTTPTCFYRIEVTLQ